MNSLESPLTSPLSGYLMRTDLEILMTATSHIKQFLSVVKKGKGIQANSFHVSIEVSLSLDWSAGK